MLNIIEGLIRQHGWRYGRLDGSTAIAGRQTLVDSFNDESSNMFIMLMTTRTGGVGLNLTGADRVLLFDPDWNPQTDAQARWSAAGYRCRAMIPPMRRPIARLASCQTRPVTIYRLIVAGTIEEKIYRQIFKTAITNRVLQDPRQVSTISLDAMHADRLTSQPQPHPPRRTRCATRQRRLFSSGELRERFTLGPDDPADGDPEGMGGAETCDLISDANVRVHNGDAATAVPIASTGGRPMRGTNARREAAQHDSAAARAASPEAAGAAVNDDSGGHETKLLEALFNGSELAGSSATTGSGHAEWYYRSAAPPVGTVRGASRAAGADIIAPLRRAGAPTGCTTASPCW